MLEESILKVKTALVQLCLLQQLSKLIGINICN